MRELDSVLVIVGVAVMLVAGFAFDWRVGLFVLGAVLWADSR
jgi:hypothetical protein